MKFYDTTYEEYITKNNKISLHPKLTTLYKSFPEDINNMQNLIFLDPKVWVSIRKCWLLLKNIVLQS